MGMRKTAALAAMVSLSLLFHGPATATVLDPAWSETTWLATGLSDITSMAWAPDGSGRLFLTRKGGEIRIVKAGPPPAVVATPFATVSPLFTSSECGLLGIAFDPDFLHNGRVYVFATVSSAEQQIIRYRAVGDTGTEKFVLIAGLPTAGANHDGGGLGFGADGKLYWGIGDNGTGTGADADLGSLASKIGRANVEGTAPEDNPFADGPGANNDYIFARGFRNPYTLTFQPETGKLWVDVAGASYEQIFAVGRGDHAGWDDFENNQPPGFIAPVIKYRTNTIDERALTETGAVRSGNVATFTTLITPIDSTHGFRQGEKITILGVADPSFDGMFYVASVPTETTFTVLQNGPNASSGGGYARTQNQGGAVTGGTFYDASGAPPAYRGNFFYGDFNSGRIMRAVVGPGTTITSVDYFATDNTNSIDIAGGSDGALYYVGYGGTIKRAAYIPAEQGLIVSNLHLTMNEGRSAAFTVLLASAPAANVTVGVARTAGSSDISVASGSSLTFTPANFGAPQRVTLSSVEDADLVADTATFTVSSTGLTAQMVKVDAVDTSGASGGASPGEIPDGAAIPGLPLTVKKNPADPSLVDLDWSAACGATATDYSVHEGALQSWYSHDAVLCTTAGATGATLRPAPGPRYFLVVPLDAQREGSYGKDSAGAERPRSNIRCRSRRDYTSCP